MQSIKIKIVLASWLALLVVPAAPVLARDGSDDSTSGTSTSTTENETETHKSTSTRTNATEVETHNKSEANKLQACRNREKSINNRLQKIANRGQRQLNLFSSIAERTENFYTDKKLSLANYDELTSAVATQKTAAQATVTKVSNDSVNFKCDGSDPKGRIEIFKTDLNAETTALKSYRTSVKNLIVGVKSALKATNTEAENANQ